jgi:DNA-binding NarL/FixJ family response regulator
MTSQRTAAGGALSPRIYRVVIVEDHALTRAGLRTALNTDQQIEVVGEAANGLDGFRIIDETKPDVAVIDIGLPGIDGIELTRRLRASVPQTHVVIVTAQDLGACRCCL